MQIVLFIALLTAGGLLNFAKKSTHAFAGNLAAAYIFVALLESIRLWFLYNTDIDSAFITKALLFQVNLTGSAGRLILGYLVVNIFLSLTSNERDDLQIKQVISLTLWGVSILTAVSFISGAGWKAENCCRVMAFFTASGYSTWFMYVIMAAEALGGLGILLHFKLKTGPVAAAGLMLMMIGNLYTHNHNNDPMSASYPAISQFITLSIMQLLYYFEQATGAPASVPLVVTKNNY